MSNYHNDQHSFTNLSRVFFDSLIQLVCRHNGVYDIEAVSSRSAATFH